MIRTDLFARARRAGRLFLLATALPLAGCALAEVGSGPAPQLFMLTAAHPTIPPNGLRPRIEIDEFSAPAAIDTARIVQQSGPNEIAYYAGARWADRAPRMIENLTIETFENAGRFGAVSARDAGLLADYELMGAIRQFAVVPGDKTEVRVEFYVRLVRKDARTVLASRLFDAKAPVDGRGLTPIVAAYDAALRQVLDSMSVWAAEEAARAPSVAASGSRGVK